MDIEKVDQSVKHENENELNPNGSSGLSSYQKKQKIKKRSTLIRPKQRLSNLKQVVTRNLPTRKHTLIHVQMKHRIRGGIAVPSHLDNIDDVQQSPRTTPASISKKKGAKRRGGDLASTETFNINCGTEEIVISEEKSLREIDPLSPKKGFQRTLMGIENDCALGGAIIGKKTSKVAYLDRMAINKGLQSTKPIKIF